MILFESLLVTISFFTTIPVKILDWTNERIRFIPLNMGFIGLIIGLIMYGTLGFIQLEDFIMALLFIVVYTVLTGGLHNDALMDTSDAHFSRRDLEKKLEIMTDSRVGAFAVMSYVNYIIAFFIITYYLFKLDINLLLILPVLFNSRALVGVMNYNLKYAKEDGLAKMYAETLKTKDKYFLYLTVLIVNGITMYFFGVIYVVVILTGICLYHIYKRFMYKQFNGITGDLLGTFVLLSELAMFLSLIMVNVWI